jgi:YD repeat-containing protein
MKSILMAATALAVLSFASCKKKDSNVTTATPVRYLKKMTQTGNGPAKVFTFTYDSQHRLLNFKTADNSDATVFTYDAAGNLVGVDETEPGFHNIYAYTYASGKPVSATFKSWKKTPGQPDVLFEDDVLTYTLTNNRVSSIHLAMQGGGDTDFALTYNAQGEMVKAADGNNFYTATFTYGSHKSPFPSISPWMLDQAGFSLHFFARHELLTSSFDFPGTALDKTETMTYTFNADGYPVTGSMGTEQTTFEYQ